MKKINRNNNCFIKRLKTLDKFGQKVELNFNGESSINSSFGAILSLFIYSTISAYALNRFQVMATYGATTLT
jgi:hypothetical protein